MANTSLTKKTSTAVAVTSAGAVRRQRAGERLAEARQQLAQLAQQIADKQQQIETAAAMEASAQKAVSAAEHAADHAAAAVVDAQAAQLVADGTPDETVAQAAYDGAKDGNTTARKALDEARATLADLHSKHQADAATIHDEIAELEGKQGYLHRLIKSLERQHETAHHDAGVDDLLALQARHQALQARLTTAQQAVADAQTDLDTHRASVEAIAAEHPELAGTREYRTMADPAVAVREIASAYTAYLDTLEKWRSHPEEIGHMHAGHNLPYLLDQDQMSRHTIHNVLYDRADTHPDKQSGWIIGLTRANVQELLTDLDAQRDRKLAALPPAK